MKQQLPVLGVWLGRIPSLLLIVAVLGTLCAPAFIQIIGRSTDVTFIFNRPPAAAPQLPRSVSALGKFRDDLISFVDDNFGLRAEMVRWNVLLHSWIGVSAVPSLLQGKDGWVFLKDNVEIFDQFRGLNRFTDQELDTWIDTAEISQQWLESQGIAFLMIIAPNQQTIYPEYMPMYANRVWPETRLDQLSRRLRERHSTLQLIDPRPDLWAARKYGRLYNKYENHWNGLGGFVGYSAAMQWIEKKFPDAKTLRLPDFNLMSAGRTWSIPPKTESVPILVMKGKSHLVAEDFIEPGPIKPVVKWSTDLDAAPDVLVYGDSFSISLLDYFRESFKSTTSVPVAYYPFPIKLIKTLRPKLVIFEMVERYLAIPLGSRWELESELLLARAPPYDEAERSIGIINGYIDGVRQQDGIVHFFGWAIDPTEKAPPTAIYAYDGRQVVAAARPSLLRTHVEPGMTDHKIGFEILVPRGVDIRQTGQRLRFFSTNPSNKIYEIKIYPPVLTEIEKILNPAGAN